MAAIIKTADQIEKMRVAGKLAAEVLEMIEPYVKAGVTTEELNTICHNYIVDVQQAIPAPAELPRLSKIHLYLGQSGNLPRYPFSREETQRWRHYQYRHHCD